jgi:hypothetical protein
MKYTALSHAMRELTEALGARRTAVLRLTNPLEGAEPPDAASKVRMDRATGMTVTESPTVAAMDFDQAEAVRQWEERVAKQVQDAKTKIKSS